MYELFLTNVFPSFFIPLSITEEINPSLSWNINENKHRDLYLKRWKGPQRRIGVTGGIGIDLKNWVKKLDPDGNPIINNDGNPVLEQ